MPRLTMTTLAIAVTLSACATTGERQPRADANRITTDQIAEATAANAYDLVQTLRPRWLQVRGPAGVATGETAVYLDGSRIGEIDVLRRISTREISGLQFLSPTEATHRFGTGHGHGAILVTTR
jgi:hypothetical protein